MIKYDEMSDDELIGYMTRFQHLLLLDPTQLQTDITNQTEDIKKQIKSAGFFRDRLALSVISLKMIDELMALANVLFITTYLIDSMDAQAEGKMATREWIKASGNRGTVKLHDDLIGFVHEAFSRALEAADNTAREFAQEGPNKTTH